MIRSKRRYTEFRGKHFGAFAVKPIDVIAVRSYTTDIVRETSIRFNRLRKFKVLRLQIITSTRVRIMFWKNLTKTSLMVL